MKLSKLEQESIILYNEEESTASIYTHDPKLIRKLKRLAEKYPDKVYPDRAVHAGAVSYAVPKSCVSVREPFSDERRRAASERAKNAGYTPMIYANAKRFTTVLHLEELSEYELWLADYRQAPDFPYRFQMWQFTEKGSVPGIQGAVDIDLYFEE